MTIVVEAEGDEGTDLEGVDEALAVAGEDAELAICVCWEIPSVRELGSRLELVTLAR